MVTGVFNFSEKLKKIMKKTFLLIAFSFCFILTGAQGLKKIPIANSGCSLYSFCDFKFETQYSEDSSIVYVSECEKEGLNYGIICVKLLNASSSLNDAERTLISYLDYLKTSFKILKSAGYGKGHKLANNEKTRGVLDYWEDSDKNNWKVKGWTDGKFIGVLYGYSAKELPDSKLNVFLDGFRFPGM
jgi:hypothetical protein